MLKQTAVSLCPSFLMLQGKQSLHYQSRVKNIFVTFKDKILARADYRERLRGYRLPSLPLDYGRFTIVAALENENIVSVRSIVLYDNIRDLIDVANQLDEMEGV